MPLDLGNRAEAPPLTEDDALYRFRMRALALATELGKGRMSGDRDPPLHLLPVEGSGAPFGPEILQPRERRRPTMANQTSPFIEQRVVALALGHPRVRTVSLAMSRIRP